MIKKVALFWLIGSVVSLYTTFVIQNLWNWFATEAFHVSQISFWVMYGMVLIIGMFSEDLKLEEQQGFKTLAFGIDACIPEDKRQMVNEQIQEQKEGIWLEVGLLVFAKISANTFTLLVGLAIHSFLV